MNNNDANKRIAKNTTFLYIRMGLVLVTQLYTTKVVFNSLGVLDYGIVNVVSGFVTMFTFLNTTMANSIQRFYNIRLGKQNNGNITDEYNTALRVQALLALFLLIFLETLGLWYVYNKMVIPADRFSSAITMFHLSVASLIIVIMQTPYSAAIMAHEKMNYYAYVSIFDVIAKLGVAYALATASSDRIILYAFLLFIVQTINFFFYFIYAKKHFISLKFASVRENGIFRSMLSFSSWNIFGIFAYMLKTQGLNMLLNAFFGPVINAARGISAMVMGAIQGFQTNTAIAFRPQIISSYAAGDYDRTRTLFFCLSKIVFISLFLLSLPIMLELDYILHLWLGKNVPNYTIIFTILVLIDMLISSLSQPVFIVVHATGKVKTFQIVTSIVIGTIVPFSWIFLKLGASAPIVYWVSLVIVMINQTIITIILHRIFPFSYSSYLKEVILPCSICSAISTCISGIIPICMETGFTRFCITCLLSTTMITTTAFVIILNKNEKNMVLLGITKFLNKHFLSK